MNTIAWLWSYYSASNLILNWAVDTFIPDREFVFYSVVYIHDAILNVAFAVPFAFTIRAMERESRWGPVLLASIAAFIWSYYYLLGNGDAIRQLFGAYVAAFTTIGLLPLAYYIAKFPADRLHSHR